jgi:hypothetical protein
MGGVWKPGSLPGLGGCDEALGACLIGGNHLRERDDMPELDAVIILGPLRARYERQTMEQRQCPALTIGKL